MERQGQLDYCDKLTISGALIERHQFFMQPPYRGSRPILTEEQKAKRKEEKRLFNEGLMELDPERIASSIARARTKIYHLTFSNAFQYLDRNGVRIPAKMLTLTIRENITSLPEANYRFTKFIQRLNYEFRNEIDGKLLYLCVPEFQERGAVHYHMILFNFPFVHYVYKRIRKAYGKDRFELSRRHRNQPIEGMIGYVTKYVTKQHTDGRYWGQKRFFTSRRLKKPIVVRDAMAVELIAQKLMPYRKEGGVIDSTYVGRIRYENFYLGDGGRLRPELFDEYSRKALELAQQP